MKTIKVARPRWGSLVVVLAAAIIIGVVFSVICTVGAPMLASKIPAAPNPAIQAIVNTIDWAGYIPFWATGALAAVGVGIWFLRKMIWNYGKAYVVRW